LVFVSTAADGLENFDPIARVKPRFVEAGFGDDLAISSDRDAAARHSQFREEPGNGYSPWH